MQLPSIIIEISLYNVDENDVKTPFTGEEVDAALTAIQSQGEICGYAINDVFVEQFEVEDDDNA